MISIVAEGALCRASAHPWAERSSCVILGVGKALLIEVDAVQGCPQTCTRRRIIWQHCHCCDMLFDRTIHDVKPGMVLPGVVTNVTNFGAFVDLGIHNNGLVHVSQMACPRPSDPHALVHTGQGVRVRVQTVDMARGRIGLSMLGLDALGAD